MILPGLGANEFAPTVQAGYGSHFELNSYKNGLDMGSQKIGRRSRGKAGLQTVDNRQPPVLVLLRYDSATGGQLVEFGQA